MEPSELGCDLLSAHNRSGSSWNVGFAGVCKVTTSQDRDDGVSPRWSKEIGKKSKTNVRGR